MGCSPQTPLVHGILQARILKCVVFSATLAPPTPKMGFSTCHSRSYFLAHEPQPTNMTVKASITPVPETFHACQPQFSHHELFLAQVNPVKFFHHSMGNNFSIRLESQHPKYVTSYPVIINSCFRLVTESCLTLLQLDGF